MRSRKKNTMVDQNTTFGKSGRDMNIEELHETELNYLNHARSETLKLSITLNLSV